MIAKRDTDGFLYWILSWVLLCNLFVVIRYVGINWSKDVAFFTSKEWVVLFGQATFIGVAGGLLCGLLDTHLNRKNYLHRISFGLIILIKSFSYFIIAIIVLFLGFYIAALVNSYSPGNALLRVLRFFSSSYFIVITTYLFINMILLNFLKQVDEKFGPGVMMRLFLGRYYRPVEEKRIFMFLDLKSSTHYAEVLGPYKYSQLIQDCFFDITPIIEKYSAQIFQYAGDAVILTWECYHRTAYDSAVMLFFGFKEKIAGRSDHYLRKYGLVPEFKAGIHAGEIVVAEVGVIKKEIAYHGDTINTTSRIQEQCNAYNQMLLCSEYFVTNLQNPNFYEILFVDKFFPKGKQNPVQLFNIKPVDRLPLKSARK